MTDPFHKTKRCPCCRKPDTEFSPSQPPTASLYGVPLNYCVIDGAIYFHSAGEGRKLEILLRNNSVSFCAVGGVKVLPEQFATNYESAIVSGRAEEVTGREKQIALEGIVKKYSSGYIMEGLEYIKANGAAARVYKIVVDSITGKARR